MSGAIRNKILSGLIWSGSESFINQFFGFIQGVILARLLMPSDFGLIAMAGVFNALARTMADSGFSTALIRKKERTDLDYSTVFDVNVVISLVLALLLCACSNQIASFYNEPLISEIVCLNALLIFLSSFTNVQSTRLMANMEFKKRSKINMIITIANGLLAIGMAYCGLGVWSLIYPYFITFVISLFLYWYYQRWFPGFRFSLVSFKELFGFGSKLLASSLLDVIYNNLYPLVIGRKYTSSDLAFYSKGDTFARLPSVTITNVLALVTLPVLSDIQNEDERLQVSYRKFISLSAFVVFPLLIGMAAVARPMVILLITNKWEQCIVYLQILCFSLMWYPIHALNLNLLKVKGRSDLFLRLEIIKKIMGLVILFVTLPMGIIYMCIGGVVSSFISLFLNTYYTGKLIRVGFYEQMKDVLPSLVYSISMGVIVWFLTQIFHPIWLQLLCGIVVGAGYYFCLAKMFHSKDLKLLFEIYDENIKTRRRN